MDKLELVPTIEPFSPLIQKNLERNTKKQLPLSQIYHVGITYPENDEFQIRVSENKTNNWKNFDKGELYSVNELKMGLCFSNKRPFNCCSDPYVDYKEAPEVLKEITSDIWEQEVVRPLLKLIDEADLKQKELSILLKSNPNVKPSAYTKFLRISYRQRYGSRDKREGARGSKDTSGIRTIELSYDCNYCLWRFGYVFVIPYIAYIYLFLFTCMILDTFLILTQLILIWLNMCTKSTIDEGRQFLDELFRDHPDLDFDSVEENIAVGVQHIVDNLNKVHLCNTPYEAISWYGSQSVHYDRDQSNPKGWDRADLKYLIIFNGKNDSV